MVSPQFFQWQFGFKRGSRGAPVASPVSDGSLHVHLDTAKLWTGGSVRFHVCVKLCVSASEDPWGSLSTPLHLFCTLLAAWGRDSLKWSVGGTFCWFYTTSVPWSPFYTEVQTFIPFISWYRGAQQMGGVREEMVVKGEEPKSANPVLPPNKHALNCSSCELICHCCLFVGWWGTGAEPRNLALRSKFISVKSKRSQILFCLSLSSQISGSFPIFLWITSSEFTAVPWVHSGA